MDFTLTQIVILDKGLSCAKYNVTTIILRGSLLLRTTEALELLEVKQALLPLSTGLLFFHCRLAAGLLKVSQESVNNVVLLMVKILVAKER